MAIGFQVVMDCADPDKLAKFWALVLHYKFQDPPPGFASWQDWLNSQNIPESEWNSASAIIDPEGVGSRIFFQRVPEPKTVKNRVHLDVNVSSGLRVPIEERRPQVDAEVERVIQLGATKLRMLDERGSYTVVMSDPEGNEFCLH